MGGQLQTDAHERVSASWAQIVRHGVVEFSAATVRRFWKAREVSAVRIRPSLAHARLVAVIVAQNEAPRFPYLIDYYRRAGVEHFIVIDNESTDGLQDYLMDHEDVTVYAAHGAYGSARYGNDWINHVAGRHCHGKWVLYVDADEMLVVAGPSRNLPEVCDALERQGRRSLHTLLLDVYSDRPASGNIVEPGADPLDTCSLYDTAGYQGFFDPVSLTTWIKGGPRARLFFDDIHDGPALNKTPLVRWKRWYALAQSSHRLVPRALNRQSEHLEGALLHFKFTSINASKFTDPGNVARHTAEYSAYSEIDSVDFVGPATSTYESVDDLVSNGLVAPLDPSLESEKTRPLPNRDT
ncbi:glycosyltransferase family 2 protein [Demequina sp. SO4-13]|uniref:glycosyltransferase family 2 protein n=1 Tax=Demequina sp. SO4-13 TaxID=3401027 RepID=UPI003AF474AC